MAFLDNAGGYTPVPDKLVRRYDFTTAYIWGVIWRYNQMEHGVCKASHEAIAERAGLSRRTAIECIHVLVKDGYIEDLTPDIKNKPHHYSTKKGEEKIKSTMQILHSGTEQDAILAQQEEPTVQNLHSDCANFAQSTVQNLHTKKVFKDTHEDILSPNGESAAKPPAQLKPKTNPAFKVFVEVTGKSQLLNNTQIKEIDKVVGRDPPNLERWRESVTAWNLNGNKPTDAAGMLDWFRTGKRSNYNPKDRVNKNGHHSKPTNSQPVARAGGLGYWTEAEIAELRATGEFSEELLQEFTARIPQPDDG